MTYSSLNRPRSSRNRYNDPPSIFELVCGSLLRKAQGFFEGLRNVYRGQSSTDGQAGKVNAFKRILKIPILLCCLWAWTIWRGERSVFQSSLAECQWHNWERWVYI